MQFKDISLRGTLNPKLDLLIKIIYGDKSDNINKIGSFITKDLALKIASMSDDIREKYLIDNNIKDSYDLNKKLVCLENIPIEIIDNFNSIYNILIL